MNSLRKFPTRKKAELGRKVDEGRTDCSVCHIPVPAHFSPKTRLLEKEAP